MDHWGSSKEVGIERLTWNDLDYLTNPLILARVWEGPWICILFHLPSLVLHSITTEFTWTCIFLILSQPWLATGKSCKARVTGPAGSGCGTSGSWGTGGGGGPPFAGARASCACSVAALNGKHHVICGLVNTCKYHLFKKNVSTVQMYPPYYILLAAVEINRVHYQCLTMCVYM